MDVKLVLVKKNGGKKSFPLPSSVTVIGRRRDCELRVPVISVSKRHCEISKNHETLKIRDLGSHNGTLLNGESIEEKEVKAGDKLQIGPLEFIFQIDGEPEGLGSSAVESAEPVEEVEIENIEIVGQEDADLPTDDKSEGLVDEDRDTLDSLDDEFDFGDDDSLDDLFGIEDD